MLKDYYLKNKAKKDREQIALKNHFVRIRNKMFLRWKNGSSQTSPAIAALKLENSAKLENQRIEYGAVLNSLKEKIIEIEQKVELIDRSHEYFSKSLSSSYIQAINVLNNELIHLQKNELSEIISRQRFNTEVTGDASKHREELRHQTKLNALNYSKNLEFWIC